jgi:copper oxidase (laccase) domain-containing protein
MEELLRLQVGGRVAVAVCTEAGDGDIHPERVPSSTLRQRQIRLVGEPWVMLDQVHGAQVVSVDALEPKRWPLSGTGDVLVANRSPDVLAVWAGDCAPIALFGANGTSRVVAHGGWRGLASGVIDVAVDAIESTGTTVAAAVLGPCIHRCCYEFGSVDLDQVAAGVGVSADAIAAVTSWGSRALDVPAAVAAGLARHGIGLDAVGVCTGCDPRFRSHRCRVELERHALVAWFEDAV